MKVVISGGIKTQNIVDGINKKFSSGGVDFIVVPFIESIEEIYQRGEYFDKAILIEQCWNHDFEDEDEASVRTRINEFATASALRGLNNVSFVFLTQDLETASKIYEEILPIHVNSVVIVKEPRYSVTFFNSLVTTEVDRFTADIVYKPVFQDEIKEDKNITEHVDTSPQYNTTYDEIDKTIFGDDEELFNANRLNKKEEMDFEGFPDQPKVNDETTEGFNDADFTPDVVAPFDDFQNEFDTDISQDNTGSVGDIPQDFDVGNDGGFSIDIEKEQAEFAQPEEAQEEYTGDFLPEGQHYKDEQTNFNVGEIPDYSGPSTSGINLDKEEPIESYGDAEFNGEYQEPYQEPYQESYQEPYQEEYNPEFDELNHGAQFSGGFDDRDYDEEPDIVAPVQPKYQRVDMSNDQIKATLDAFANRGNSILLTGCGGCGTSTMALNLANTINNLGYTVLLVDLDTENKAQSYMSRENYECVEPDSAGLMAAINSTSGINAHVSIVRQGFHLLTMGMASDSAQIDKVIQKEKISRFINLAKTSHNFVIYDVPFKTAIGFGKDFTFMADNIVVTLDCSNWGISKTMLNMCNIEDDDMQETLFNRGQLIFNRYRVLNKVMGNKVKTAIDITRVMDAKVRDLLGEDPGFYFQSMHVSGLINEDKAFEAGWFESTQYSDTPDGSKTFIEVLKNIVLKR